MKRLILTLASAFIAWVGYSQPDNLVFIVNNATPYQNLTAPTIVTTTDWDDFDATIPLGFMFKAMEDSTNTLYFDSNDMNSGTELQFKTSSMTSNPFNAFSWMYDLIDMHAYDNTQTSTVGYKTDVVSGKKITKIEWNNVAFYDDEDSSAFANVQMWLYEANNAIEFRFGNSSRNAITTIANDPNGAYGFNGPVFALVKDVDLNTGNGTKIYLPSSVNPPAMDSATFMQLFTSPVDYGIDSFPNANTLFRWAPAQVNTSSNSIALTENVTIYPNPATNNVTITTSKISGYTLRLYATNGICVKQQTLEGLNNNVDLSQLASGNYFLVLANKEERIQYKITKQ